MNRRKKKRPQQTDYIALFKQKWVKLDWSKFKDASVVRNLSAKVKSLWSRLPKLHQRALMVLVPALVVLLVLPAPKKTEVLETQPTSGQRVEITINTQSLSEQPAAQAAAVKSEAWKEYTVKQGDTLAAVFRNIGLPMSDLNALVKVEGNDKPLSRIKQGQLVRFKLAANGDLDILQLEKSAGSVMFFRLSDGGFGRSK
ncbi:LysM-like peptidoglycan-binding domain-containing protein [Vibrio mexicanus]|uniref:LysM-like peptidoglycan-binding domain-containing protein n=1 Tax=Vibrio mexicanus TaxID=1004326 RepID=UPI00063C1963|nr:LysM-like peptidoglycan-binding domain-containing protein [Vibrio mexicanus]